MGAGGAGWCCGGPRSAFGIVRRSGAAATGCGCARALYLTGADPTVA